MLGAVNPLCSKYGSQKMGQGKSLCSFFYMQKYNYKRNAYLLQKMFKYEKSYKEKNQIYSQFQQPDTTTLGVS